MKQGNNMHQFICRLVALLLLVITASSCGRTIYSRNYTGKKKYSNYKSNNHFWHKHQSRPRARHGGYW